ncbi:MAG: WbqC family protein [Cecembia sp.]
MQVITTLFYLPNLEYFTAILDKKEIILDGIENYQKQTFRNRSKILLANKVETLSVPVLGGNKNTKYREVRIDYNQKWKNVHLRGIQSAYGKAPFFEYFYPYIDQVFRKNHQFLFDMNLELLTVCLKLLQLNVKVSVREKEGQIADSMDIRGLLKAKASPGVYKFYQEKVYSQLFGVNFAPNLSILDLLFCEGTSAVSILKASQKK